MADTQINVGMNVDGVITGTEKAKRSLKDLGGAASDAGKSTAKIGDGSEAAANKIERDTKRIQNEFKRLQVAAESAGKSLSESMVIKANAYGVPLSSIQAQIDGAKAFEKAQLASNQALMGSHAVLQNVGMSARATSAALRNVPAQFTDIVTSLQGGQKPMTVLLQQGGQLKDMFGGAGNAAKALGGYVMGLVNPVTLAAAAAATLGYAYIAGRAESEAYNKALIMTGNSAGTTAVQLSNMAQAVSKATGGTVGAAADALAQLAGSSNIAASQFERIAATAIAMEKTTGVAVSETVKQFSELGKDPLAASIKLNDSTRFLTMSVYEQIKALTEQGRTIEAGALAQKSYADVMDQRTPKLIENLGLVESGWRMITKAIGEASDAIKGIGRSDDPYKKAQDMAADLRFKLADPGLTANYGGRSALESQLVALKPLLDYTAAIESSKSRSAAHDARTAAAVTAQISADKEHDKYLSKAVQQQHAIAQAVALYANVDLSQGNNLKNYVETIKGIQDKFKETAAPKSKEIKADGWLTDVAKAYSKAMDDLDKVQIKASSSADALSKSQEALRAIQASPTWAAFSRQKQEQIIYQASLAQSAEDEATATKATIAAHKDYINALSGSAEAIEKKQLAMNDEVQAYGVSIAQNISLAEAIDVVAIARLNEQKAIEMSYGNVDAVAQIEREIAAREKLRSSINSHDANKAIVDAQKEQQKEWKKTVEKYDDIFRTGFAGMLNGGQGAWKSFTKSLTTTFKTSVADQLYKMFAQPFVMRIVASLIGVSGSGAAGLAQATGFGTDGTNAMNGFTAASNLSNLSSTLGAGFQALTGSMAGASAASLAYANAVGAVGGDSLGALIAANGGWAGVSTPTVAGQVGALGTAEGAGSGVASGLGTLGYAAGGVLIGSTIAGNKELFGMNGTVTSAVGAAAGATFGSYFGPWGTLIGGVIGGVVNAAFGQGPTEMDSSGIRGTLSNNGIAGNAYANMSQDAGWFNDGDNWTELRAIPEGIGQNLNKAFAGTKIAVANLAVSLGLSTAEIVGYAKYIDIAAGTSNENIGKMFEGMKDEMAAQLLAGKTGQIGAFDASYYGAQNPDIQQWFDGVQNYWIRSWVNNGGSMAAAHFDNVGRYEGRAQNAQSMVTTGPDYTSLIRDGETANATLTRLSASLGTVNQWLSMLGKTLLATSLVGGDMAAKLSDSFGAMDRLTTSGQEFYKTTHTEAEISARNLGLLSSSSKSYYETYYSQTERNTRSMEDMGKALSLVNIAIPATKDAFRGIVTGLDLTTEAGRQTYAMMMTIAPEFASTIDSIASLSSVSATSAAADISWQQKIDIATGVTTQKEIEKAAALLAGNDATDILINQFYALEDAATAAAAAAELAKTNAGWQDRIDVLTGAKTQRQISQQNELAGVTDTTTISLINQTHAQENLAYEIDTIGGMMTRIAAIQRTAASALSAASGAVLQQLTTLQTAQNTAASNLTSALSGVTRAIAQAAKDVTSAEIGVTSARNNITKGYLNAQQKVADLQMQVADQMRTSATGLIATLASLSGTGSNGNAIEKYAALRQEFEALATRARAGDATAASQVGAAGVSYLEASKNASSSYGQFQIDDTIVRQVLGGIATSLNAAASSTPTAIKTLDTQLVDALTEFSRWQNAAAVSGASTVEVQESLLNEYNDSVRALSTAQFSQIALNASIRGLNALMPAADGAFEWSAAVSAARSAVNESEVATRAFSDALHAATVAGVDVASLFSTSTEFESAMTSFITSQADYIAVRADTVAAELSLQEQYALLTGSMAQAISNSTGQAASASMVSSVMAAYGSIGRSGLSADKTDVSKIDFEGFNYWVDKLASGDVSPANFQNVFLTAAANYIGSDAGSFSEPIATAQQLLQSGVDLPSFAVGTNYVPHDMVAQIHQGEAIIPAAFNPANYGASSGNTALVTEIKMLREEVQNLRAEARSIAVSSSKTASILDRVTPDGDAIETRVAA